MDLVPCYPLHELAESTLKAEQPSKPPACLGAHGQQWGWTGVFASAQPCSVKILAPRVLSGTPFLSSLKANMFPDSVKGP